MNLLYLRTLSKIKHLISGFYISKYITITWLKWGDVKSRLKRFQKEKQKRRKKKNTPPPRLHFNMKLNTMANVQVGARSWLEDWHVTGCQQRNCAVLTKWGPLICIEANIFFKQFRVNCAYKVIGSYFSGQPRWLATCWSEEDNQ